MLSAVTTTTRVARDMNVALLAYVRLTKPRIVLLLVITTIPAMILADGGLPSPWLILATVLGGSVVAGGANALNMYFDRDIDELMLRTRDRPVPAGQIEPEKAALFGLALALGGFLFLEWTVNLLAAALTLAAFCFYVLVYTVVLKRTTPLNIVIGGGARVGRRLLVLCAAPFEIFVSKSRRRPLSIFHRLSRSAVLRDRGRRAGEGVSPPDLPHVAGCPIISGRLAYSLSHADDRE